MNECTLQEKKEQQIRLLCCLNDNDWELLRNKVILYVLYNYGRMLHDRKGDDVVQAAILLTFDCTRLVNWSSDLFTDDKEIIFRDLLSHLCWAARSIISHQAEKEGRMKSIDALQDEETSSVPAILPFQIPAASKSPDDNLLYEEVTARLNREEMDEFAREVLRLRLKYPDSTPKEIAEELKVSVIVVQNATKRISRKLSKITQVLLNLKNNKPARASVNIFPDWRHDGE